MGDVVRRVVVYWGIFHGGILSFYRFRLYIVIAIIFLSKMYSVLSNVII